MFTKFKAEKEKKRRKTEKHTKVQLFSPDESETESRHKTVLSKIGKKNNCRYRGIR